MTLKFGVKNYIVHIKIFKVHLLTKSTWETSNLSIFHLALFIY